MSAPYWARVSRRTTLRWLAAATAASALPQYGLAAVGPIAQGYGMDPDLDQPLGLWPRTMTPPQLQLIAALADLILPGTGNAPAPSALGIADFIDEWVSAPYPQQQADRRIVLAGLSWVDDEAKKHGERGFLQIDDEQQRLIVDTMAGVTLASIPLPGTFFSRLRFLVVGAYYTTPDGFRDIGYLGNVPLASYPPVTNEEQSILKREWRKLGIEPRQ